jgi:hypothetical protein
MLPTSETEPDPSLMPEAATRMDTICKGTQIEAEESYNQYMQNFPNHLNTYKNCKKISESRMRYANK